MREATETSDALVKRLSKSRRQGLRKNVQLLFLGLRSEETDPIISLLRGARLAPRGREITSEEDFLQALTEKSWDLIICAAEHDQDTVIQSMHNLKRLDKDIPVIQLVPHANSLSLLQGLKQGMHAVVPLEEKELFLHIVRKELDNLECRRRMRHAESSLIEAEKRCSTLMETSTLAIAHFSTESLIKANNSFAQIFGYEDAKKLKGKTIDAFIVPEDRVLLFEHISTFAEQNLSDSQFQLTASRADNSNFVANIHLQEIRLDNELCLQVTVLAESLKTAKKTFEEHDPVTGLYNASYFDRRLSESIQHALDGGNDCSLIAIEIDQYETLLSEYGRDAADHVTRDIADIIKQHLNPVHIKARLSDPCFTVIFQDPNPDKAVNIAEELRQAIASHTAKVTTHEIKTTVSIGIATITDTAPNKTELLQRALETAANNHSGNGVLVYTPPKKPLEHNNSKAINAIKQAVEEERFKLLYQPIVPLSYNSKVSHYEALIRLLDQQGNTLEPSLFLSTMEAAELSNAMDRWVIKEGIKKLRSELDKGSKHRLFFNSSSDLWRDSELLPWLSECLREHRIPANHLVFQLSESDCSSHMNLALDFTAALKKLKCLICIKHFGCSGNGHQILRQIGPDYVKLDGSFVQDLENKKTFDESFETLIEDLKAQGKITIAPQVENAKVMSRLWKTGIGLIQGYYLQPPIESMDYDFFDQ